MLAVSSSVFALTALNPESLEFKQKYQPYIATVVEVTNISELRVRYRGRDETVVMTRIASWPDIQVALSSGTETVAVTASELTRFASSRAAVTNYLASVLSPGAEVLLEFGTERVYRGWKLAEPRRDSKGRLVADVNLVYREKWGIGFSHLAEHLLLQGFALPTPDLWQSLDREKYTGSRDIDRFADAKKNHSGIWKVEKTKREKSQQPAHTQSKGVPSN